MSVRLIEQSRQASEDGRRLVAPLLGFPGIGPVGSTIKLAQQNYDEHRQVVSWLAERFSLDIIFFLMDLSVEVNALGRATYFPIYEAATVPKAPFDFEGLERMAAVDIAADGRVMTYVETMRRMTRDLPAEMVRGAYVTGPYTLAGLVMGAGKAAMATVTRVEALHRLIEMGTTQIERYLSLLIEAGADLIVLLEPTGMMLGPNHFRTFSTQYVERLVDRCHQAGVDAVYHVCGNAMHLIEALVAAGVDGLSLDSEEAGVDLPQVAEDVPPDVVVIGNLSPIGTMLTGSPAAVREEANALLEKMANYPNFVLSTGCDLPPETPLENVEAFVETGRAWRR